MKVLLVRALEVGEILLGKTFFVNGSLVFYHEGRDEEWFRDLNSPYGVDQDVAQWLQTMAVEQVHHYVRSSDRLYMARLADLMEFGVPHDLPDISRLYLPAPLWTVQEGREYRRPWIEDKVYFADWANTIADCGLAIAD